MGKIYQGILGGCSSKVGSVVGASWKGIPVLRVYQPVVANPKTAGQVQTRTGFKAFAQLASAVLSSYIKPLWDRDAVRMSGYNAFMQANKVNIASGLSPVAAQFIASRGKLAATSVTKTASAASGISLSWSSSASSRYSLATDILYLLAIDEDENIIFAGQVGVGSITRASGTATIATASLQHAIISGKKIEMYASFVRADGSVIGNDDYTQVTAGA